MEYLYEKETDFSIINNFLTFLFTACDAELNADADEYIGKNYKEVMELRPEDDYTYLRWKDFRLSSDSIIVELRYNKYIDILNQVYERIRREGKDVEEYYEDLLRKGYTIGGMILFPQHPGSMNQNRGTNRKISDRWDLTLDCIRRYYEGVDSPLYKTIERDKDFFDLFIDFKGYVDFFFLQGGSRQIIG